MAQTQSPWKQTTVYSVRNESYLAELHDDGVVQQSKLSNNAHEAPSRSVIELNTVKEDTLSALAWLGKNANLNKTTKKTNGVRHFNQGRGRCRDNDQRGKGDRHPRNAANAIEGTALVAKVGVAAKTTNADRMEQQHAQRWETPNSHVRPQK